MITFETLPAADAVKIEAHLDGTPLGYIDLARIDAKTYDAVHTRVFTEFEGHGYGKQLVGAAVEWARGEGVQLRASCPYAKVVLARNPAWQDVRT